MAKVIPILPTIHSNNFTFTLNAYKIQFHPYPFCIWTKHWSQPDPWLKAFGLLIIDQSLVSLSMHCLSVKPKPSTTYVQCMRVCHKFHGKTRLHSLVPSAKTTDLMIVSSPQESGCHFSGCRGHCHWWGRSTTGLAMWHNAGRSRPEVQKLCSNTYHAFLDLAYPRGVTFSFKDICL